METKVYSFRAHKFFLPDGVNRKQAIDNMVSTSRKTGVGQGIAIGIGFVLLLFVAYTIYDKLHTEDKGGATLDDDSKPNDS